MEELVLQPSTVKEELLMQPSTVVDNWCSQCNKKYSSSKALKKHLKTIHGPKSHYPCNRCFKVFTCEEYLKYHIYFWAGQCKIPENKTKCDISDNSLTEKRKPCEQDLDEHVITVVTEHGENIDAVSSTELNNVEYKKTNYFCKEEGCNNKNFPSVKSLREHLINIHEMPMTKSTHSFSSLRDFTQWKDDLCEKLGVYYSKTVSWQSGNSKSFVHYCQRSGKHVSTSTGQKRLKLKDTCKIGHNCTSSIKVVVTDGIYNVDHFEDHYGHTVGTSGIVHMPLPESTRNLVIEMLQNKVPRKDIPRMIRENDSTGERSKLITYQDVLNIENKLMKSFQGLQPNKRICFEKRSEDQDLSDEIEDILRQIKEKNKSGEISSTLRKFVKTQLTQTLAVMNAQS